MCEADAYLIVGDNEELVMKAVRFLRPDEGKVFLKSIYGEQRTLRGRIVEMDLIEHRILLIED